MHLMLNTALLAARPSRSVFVKFARVDWSARRTREQQHLLVHPHGEHDPLRIHHRIRVVLLSQHRSASGTGAGRGGAHIRLQLRISSLTLTPRIAAVHGSALPHARLKESFH